MSLIKFGITERLKKITGWEPVVLSCGIAYDIVIGATDYYTALAMAPKLIPGASIANPTTEEEVNTLLTLQRERFPFGDNLSYEFWVNLDDDGDGVVAHLCHPQSGHTYEPLDINYPDLLGGFCIEYPITPNIQQTISNFITSDNKNITTKDSKIFACK